jgi:hypothetical protein
MLPFETVAGLRAAGFEAPRLEQHQPTGVPALSTLPVLDSAYPPDHLDVRGHVVNAVFGNALASADLQIALGVAGVSAAARLHDPIFPNQINESFPEAVHGRSAY